MRFKSGTGCECNIIISLERNKIITREGCSQGEQNIGKNVCLTCITEQREV